MNENKIVKQNSLNNLLNSYFNLFVVILTTFLLFMAYSLILKPKVDATTIAISDNISQQQKIVQAEQTKLNSLKKSVESYQKINPIDLNRVNNILPNEYDKEKLFGELEEIITKNGYEANSISLTKEGEVSAAAGGASPDTKVTEKASDKLGVINVTLVIGSINYANFKNFLGVLENNLRIFDITSVAMSGNSANISLLTYYYKK